MVRRRADARAVRVLAEAADEPPRIAIGAAIRARRGRLGLTLQALADRAELSAPFLSQAERGLTTPSLVSLMAIAGALGVDINYFVAVPRPGQIVRRGAQPDRLAVDSRVEYQRLSGAHEERKLEALLMVVPAGLSAPPTRRDGEGFWYVLDGELEVTVGDERFVLARGDSAHFDQRHPYTMANQASEPVRILWVGTPALF